MKLNSSSPITSLKIGWWLIINITVQITPGNVIPPRKKTHRPSFALEPKSPRGAQTCFGSRQLGSQHATCDPAGTRVMGIPQQQNCKQKKDPTNMSLPPKPAVLSSPFPKPIIRALMASQGIISFRPGPMGPQAPLPTSFTMDDTLCLKNRNINRAREHSSMRRSGVKKDLPFDSFKGSSTRVKTVPGKCHEPMK